MDGRHLKSQIAFKCKKTAHYQSILNKQGLKKSKRIGKINTKFKGIQKQLPKPSNKLYPTGMQRTRCRHHSIGIQ